MPGPEWHLVCGMLNTKDVAGYMAPLAAHAATLHAVAVPESDATLLPDATAAAATAAGIGATTAPDPLAAARAIVAADPAARILTSWLALPGGMGPARERLRGELAGLGDPSGTPSAGRAAAEGRSGAASA